MESWRNRGFVPDSDDDEEFDSQSSGRDAKRRRFNGDVADTLVSQDDMPVKKHSQDSREYIEENRHEPDTQSEKKHLFQHQSQRIATSCLNEAISETEQPSSDVEHRGFESVDDSGRQRSRYQVEPPLPGNSGHHSDISSSDDELQCVLGPPNLKAIQSPRKIEIQNQIASCKITIDPPNDTSRSRQEDEVHCLNLAIDEDNDDEGSISSLSPPPLSLRLDDGSMSDKDSQQIVGNLNNQLVNEDVPQSLLLGLSHPVGRSFRQRNPIQLRPYFLEDARYRSQFKESGIKPIRIQEQHAPSTKPNHHSQEDNFIDDQKYRSISPVTDVFIRPLSANPRGQSPNESSLNRPTSQERSSDHDIDHCLGRIKFLGRRNNREHPLQTTQLPPPLEVVIDNTPITDRFQSTSVMQSLLSPPASGSTASSQASYVSGFRFPRSFSPPTLTTPITETKPKPQEPHDYAISVWPQMGVQEASSKDIDNEETSLHPGSETDPQPQADQPPKSVKDEVKRLQRKIKGVLPASWLRLDLKQQALRSLKPLNRQQQDIHAVEPAERVKGVARRIVKNNSAPLSSPTWRRTEAFALGLSQSEGDNSDSSTNDHPRNGESKILSGFQLTSLDLDLEDDIPEDNRIDYMFPSTVQAYNAGHTQRGKNPKTYRRRTRGQDNPSMRVEGLRKVQTRLTDVSHPKRKQIHSTPRAPKLGILDAPDLTEISRENQPLFLRVAARKARSRRDKGRRGASHKVFRMSSRHDTEDLNETLQQWKQGGISRIKRPPPLHKPQNPRRNPLSIHSENTVSLKKPHVPSSPLPRTHKNSGRKWIDDSVSDANDHSIDQVADTNESKTAKIAYPMIENSPLSRPYFPRNRWIVSRNYAISSFKRVAPRPAEFEVGPIHARSPLLFNQSLAALNRYVKASKQSHREKTSFTLRRYLLDRNQSSTQPIKETDTAVHMSPTTLNSGQGPRDPLCKKRLRKRSPKHINPDSDEHKPSLNPMSKDPTPRLLEKPLSLIGSDHGLQIFDSSYNLDFSVLPLRGGTFFHESTFIGSGEFARSLNISERNLDHDVGYSLVRLYDDCFRWGQWKESVSSQLGRVFRWMSDEVETFNRNSTASSADESRIHSVFTCVIRYVTEKLSFADSIDRAAFVDKAISLVASLNERIISNMVTQNCSTRICLRLHTFNLVFANQILQVASHDLVPSPKQDVALELVKGIARRVSELILNVSGVDEIRAFLAENKHTIQREGGIRDDFLIIEAYVIMHHVLHSGSRLTGSFDEILCLALLSNFQNGLRFVKNIQQLEQIWQTLFSTLPLNEIDKFGIGRIGSRFAQPVGSWTVVKQIAQSVLEQEGRLSDCYPVAFINYCRVMLHRSFHLVNYWGWRDCKVILEKFFDFFAKNSLHNLKNEESFGSPSFLDNLDSEPQIEVQLGEPCFHIFLKMVATGLRFVSETYDKKRTRNLAWRLLPNHGRVYPKDHPLQQADLDALRNHHDLLCTLFWAVPDDCRPRLAAIRGLVDPNSSHQETLALSIRAWSRLVRFKLSTDEETVSLKPFADWSSDFISDLVRQHALARSEVESQTKGNISISKHVIESTISQNQRQIESLLINVLSNLRRLLNSSRSVEDARTLVKGTPFSKLLGLFSVTSNRVNAVVVEALSVVISFLQVFQNQFASSLRITDQDESQEYGDWTDIDMLCEDVQTIAAPNPSILYIEEGLHPVVFQFISNCFGEENSPDDSTLLSVIDCWSTIAHILVNDKRQLWDGYIGPYGNYSWKTLRSTIQTKKFTPHFLSSCIKKDIAFYAEYKLEVLGYWMSSLVERTSMLKFQHELTTCLLNEDPKNPLLYNLPFHQNPKDGRVDITLREFSQRRLLLISSLLSNMREHLQKLGASGGAGLTTTRDEYKELILILMMSMKANYQELGPIAESTQNDYVSFVHRVVEFLQQHVQNICPIDKFFTDPTSFPLPATDPTYIVARLRSYGIRLSSAKAAKQLVMFFQNVCERAALDCQQEYLVGQLCKCVSDEYEQTSLEYSTLFAFFMQCVFPIYIENIFSNGAAWILGVPVLQTITCAFEGLISNLDVDNPNFISSLNDMFSAVISATYQAVQLLVDHSGQLEEPVVLATTTLIIRMIIAALPTLDYLKRSFVLRMDILSLVESFRDFALFAASTICEPSMATNPRTSNELNTDNSVLVGHVPSFFNEAKDFARRELDTWLRNSWSRHDGRYFIRRGNQSKEVNVTGLLPQADGDTVLKYEQTKFLSSVLVFCKTIQHLDIFDEEGYCLGNNNPYFYHATIKAFVGFDSISDNLAEMII